VIIPFKTKEVFEVSDNIEVKIHETSDNLRYITVDNFYKNYDKLYDILTNHPVPNYKGTHLQNSRNFVDYYDCRPHIPFEYDSDDPNIDISISEAIEYIINIANDIWKDRIPKGKVLDSENNQILFNYFKHIKLPKHKNMQMTPHVDTPIGGVIFLDKVSSGGTAIYKRRKEKKKHESKKGDEDLFRDITGYDKIIIPAKPNRLVLFPAVVMHGGYISDHSKYLNEWRINQVIFLHEKDDKNDEK